MDVENEDAWCESESEASCDTTGGARASSVYRERHKKELKTPARLKKPLEPYVVMKCHSMYMRGTTYIHVSMVSQGTGAGNESADKLVPVRRATGTPTSEPHRDCRMRLGT